MLRGIKSKKEFEDTKGVIRIRRSKKNKRTNNDLQDIHIKLKIEKNELNKKPG